MKSQDDSTEPRVINVNLDDDSYLQSIDSRNNGNKLTGSEAICKEKTQKHFWNKIVRSKESENFKNPDDYKLVNEVFGGYNIDQRRVNRPDRRSTDTLQFKKWFSNRSLMVQNEIINSQKKENLNIAPEIRKYRNYLKGNTKKVSPRSNIQNYSYLAMTERKQSPLKNPNTTFSKDYKMEINPNRKIRDRKLKDLTVDWKEEVNGEVKVKYDQSMDLKRARSSKRGGKTSKPLESKTNLYTWNGFSLAILSPVKESKDSQILKVEKT